MEDVITLSSGSETDDSDVEIVGVFSLNSDTKLDNDVRVKHVDFTAPKVSYSSALPYW